MAKFVYLYSGGEQPETAEAQADSMQEWGTWFGGLGQAVIDMGNPFGAASTVTSDGTTVGGTSQVSGYSVVEAESLNDAAAKAASCPIVRIGGTVEVYDTIAM